jgi:putative heme-binding domain-containing protein
VDPEKRPWRAQIVELLKRERDFPFATIPEQEPTRSSLEKSYAPVFDWFIQSRPVYAAQLDEPDGENPTLWDSRFKAVQLKTGDIARGQSIFQDRGCAGCHSGTSHLGPDLGGIHLRLPRRAVFDAVVFPNRDIAPGYRATVIQMNDRSTYTGSVAHEAFDIVFLQPDATQAFRLARSNIQSKHVSHRSFMPAGLLKGLDAQSLADLFAFMSSIPPEPR